MIHHSIEYSFSFQMV